MPRKSKTDRLRLTSLSELDGRTSAAKEARDMAAQITRDIGGDPTAAQRVLIEQSACISALCGDFGKRFLTGQLAPGDIPNWLASVNALRRTLEAVGLERVAKEVSFRDYLAQKTHHEPPQGDEEASQ